jgi:oxygen-independent coproporphyrinogen-3 oxidase
MESVRHLYLHFPFCPHICPYCSFHVLPMNKQKGEVVIELILKEFKSIQNDLKLETIFFGGGTPSALSIGQMERLFSEIIPAAIGEITCECNPSTLSIQKAEKMLALGVNRLSIGAQSLDPEVLKVLGRTHSVVAIEQCFQTAREAGFQNLNLDLIFGVPGQSLDSWKKTLEKALALKPQHLSCYGLTYEEDTEFFLRRQKKELQADEDLEREMFDIADLMLTQAGFIHYEISNYALPGFESRHNLAYWRGKDYYGIGPSAVSTIRGIRKTNSKFNGAKWDVESEEILSLQTLAAERMALGLRTEEGVQEEAFAKTFGFAPTQRWGETLQLLQKNGLMTMQPSFRLTRRGREVADEIAAYFV